jgi:hypothetical protein
MERWALRSGWEGYSDATGSYFKTQLLYCDAGRLSRRQIEDWHRGAALMAAAFQPDERFTDQSTPEERVNSIRVDEDLEVFRREMT